MLLLDAGNTRVKWALTSDVDSAWLYQGTVAVADAGALTQAFAGLPEPRRILASNVAGESVARHIRAACAAWNCTVEFTMAQAEQCGVRNGYTQPGQLGSDRWAALLAAWRDAQKACLVVNCGTATTVDALSGGGEFLGGLILPGLDMMRRSLAAGTAQLEMQPGRWSEFPRTTADGIYSGAIKATIGAIYEQYRLLDAGGARCLLAGGSAELIQPYLSLPVLRRDDLVLRGLHLIGQETGRV